MTRRPQLPSVLARLADVNAAAGEPRQPEAVQNAVGEEDFNEIIVSTLNARTSLSRRDSAESGCVWSADAPVNLRLDELGSMTA